jgi:glycosyltransferase involved in cell wall biosynthesis
MKIALNAWFIEQPTTGSGQYLTHLLTEYAAHYARHRYLLCLPSQQVDTGRITAGLPNTFEPLVLHTPFDGQSRHLAKVWFEQVSFPLACRRWQADLIHVPYWASPLFFHTPTVVTVHDLIPLLLPAYRGGILGKAYTRLVSITARRATRVLTDSESSRGDIIRHLHIAPHRVQAIYLAAEKGYHPIHDPTVQDRVAQKYDLPPRYLLYLGGFEVRKNVPGILRAFERLDASGACADLHLAIAGVLPRRDSAFFPDPQRLAAELGILERVHFCGWVDQEDKPALYSAAVAVLFPSHYEGFGLPPLEAMACGTPAIVSDRSSLPEVVGDGGLCVDADDLDALAGAMERVASNAALRDRLGAAALAQARRFSWRRTAHETMAAYRRGRQEHGSPESTERRFTQSCK